MIMKPFLEIGFIISSWWFRFFEKWIRNSSNRKQAKNDRQMIQKEKKEKESLKNGYYINGYYKIQGKKVHGIHKREIQTFLRAIK